MSPDAPPAPWHLDALQSATLPSGVEITRGGIMLGRDPGNAIPLPSSQYPGVSARHARVALDDAGAPFVEDLNSRNGTFVNGEAVTRRPLRAGDVLELGTGGPRFAVRSPVALDSTLAIPRDAVAPRRSIGTETMEIVRQNLGIPQNQKVGELIERKSRRQGRRVAVLLLVVAGAGVWAWWSIDRQSEASRRDLDAMQREVDESRDAWAAQMEANQRAWEAQSRQFEAQQTQWESQRGELEAERESLETQLKDVAQSGASTAGLIESLREQLAKTNESLERFDPVNLEQDKLEEVSRVEKAVVFVEVQVVYKDEATGRTMYYDRDPDGTLFLNDQGQGVPLTRDSSGSGFCISDDGFILTNAHVVNKKENEVAPIKGADYTLVPELQLAVLFSHDPRRHTAQLVRWVASGNDDVALIKIEPFEGMPFLESFTIDTPPPRLGSEVFLLGFPLGRKALQKGDTVIASTFRGILSRDLGDFLQVDAAVHPGNSGGPLIDGQGRVLGIVTAMQALDDEQGTTAIGYVIPIRAAAKVLSAAMAPPAPGTTEGPGASAPGNIDPAVEAGGGG